MLAASPRRVAVVALAALPIAACSLGSSTARFSRASRATNDQSGATPPK
jgi:hypothetical protein